MKLTGRVAVITGANGHLGQAVSHQLATAGATLALLGRKETALRAIVSELPGSPSSLTIVCDVTQAASVQTAMAQVHAELGGPHLLLNVVGGYAGGQRLPDLDVAVWQEMLALNLTSAFLCCKYALPYMLEQDYGRIVNVASRSAQDPPPGAAAYTVAKAGVSALTTAMARELRGTNVSVAAVAPGTIDTPTNRTAMPKADPAKWVTPEQVAAIMELLCTEAAGAANGAIIPVFRGA